MGTGSLLPLVVQDFYLVMMYRSMLTLAFHGLLRPREFTYSPHVVRIENVFFDNGAVIIFLPTSKAHNKNFTQRIRVAPQRDHCPVGYLIDFLKVRPFTPGPLFVKQDNMPIQYNAVLTLFHDLAHFLEKFPNSYWRCLTFMTISPKLLLSSVGSKT